LRPDAALVDGGNMLKRLVWIPVLLVAAFFCRPACAQSSASTARVRYSLWSCENSAKLKVTSGGTFGTEFSLNDLGMHKKEDKPVEIWQLEMWEGPLRFDISFWEQRWDGYAQINRNIAFEGITYNLGDVVDSSFRMRVTDISLATSLGSSFKAAFAAVGGVKYIEYYVKLWDQTPGSEVVTKEEAIAPIPYLGVSAQFTIGETTVIGGRFVMFQYSYSGTHVDVPNYYQFDVYIEFRPGGAAQGISRPESSVAMRIGFHNISLTYENHTPDDRFKITHLMRGVYAAIYLSF
jgi:hypothetical protein